MNCKEFESHIPAFIDKTLDYKTMEEFREHYESCSECREELSIQFLVRVGVQHLDNDDDKFYKESQRYVITLGCILLGLLLIWHLG